MSAAACVAKLRVLGGLPKGLPMQYLQRLFYVSRALGDAHDHVTRILSNCRVKNRRLDITGMLAFSGEHFAQILEGTEARLAPLLKSIMADERHSDVRVVFAEPITRRQYGEWSMGYVEGFGARERIESLLRREPAADDGVQAFATRLFAEPRL